MSAYSPLEVRCIHCSYGRRVDGTVVTALPGIVCSRHVFQYHPQSQQPASDLETGPVPKNPSERMGVMMKPELSASTIAKSNPEIYDVFAQVCGPGSYIPNSRLQQLVDAPVADKLAIQFKCEVARLLSSVDTFRKVDRDSETMIVDPNLQRMLSLMASYSEKSLTSAKQLMPDSSMYLASATSTEYCLFSTNGPAGLPQIVGTEAEGMESSVRQCYPQLIALCGNSCLELSRIGLSREDCVVPGVAMAGASCQFLAMYLLRDSFPVLVALSPLLSPFGTWDEQIEVAEWCLRLVAFARQTVDKTRRCKSSRAISVSLNMTEYFAKPVKMALHTKWK